MGMTDLDKIWPAGDEGVWFVCVGSITAYAVIGGVKLRQPAGGQKRPSGMPLKPPKIDSGGLRFLMLRIPL